MSFTLVVVSPSHRCDAHIAIAASHADAIGLVDLTHASRDDAIAALDRLHHLAADSALTGVRFDLFESVERLATLADFLPRAVSHLVLCGLSGELELLSAARASCGSFAQKVVLEVYDVHHAQLAEKASFDGVVLKGHEAGGRVSRWSSYLLLQKIRGKLTIPYWVQGGIGPESAAAARFAGAAGVVLCEQMWFAADVVDARERELWQYADGSETQLIGDNELFVRFYNRCGRSSLAEFARKVAVKESWANELWRTLASQATGTATTDEGRLIPVAQDIGLAAGLARKYGTVGRILTGIRKASERCVAQAASQKALAPSASLATSWGTRYSIAQGPMTRVSDVASFAHCVAEQGALPFLALALLRGPEVDALLADTKTRLGDLPWGVGILGFVPPKLRKEQLAVVLEAKPKFAIVAGGRPSQATDLERAGISTYLHVPSPGLLTTFYSDGSRKFIFEGRECGGHVGPRPSFVLWQSVIAKLMEAAVDLSDVDVIFAGGIHDAFSSAIVAVLAAPLVERGAKVGVLMGTSYLFTPEAVASGAITKEFQEQAIRCERTALLESGPGHSTRCVPTAFVDEFEEKKRDLVAAGKPSDQVRLELEMLNVGRLRLASKGVYRLVSHDVPKGGLAAMDVEAQRRLGMYMIGDVATMRSHTTTMLELHESVTSGCGSELERFAGDPVAARVTDRAKKASEPIAIVGMGCMFPDSPSIRQYWQNIFRRFDAIREVPASRWRVDDYFSSNRVERDRVYSKWGSFLDDYRFDPVKYRIPPAALASIEPVQLLALEVAEQALEDAGYRYDGFPRERTAVIFGAAGTHDIGLGYAFRTMMRHHLPKVEGLSNEARDRIYESLDEELPKWTEDSFPGFLLNVIPGRISNRFDLRGPNFAVDAACASSIAAVHAAMQQLRMGSCDAALVGAIDATNNAFCFMSFAKTHALSPRGKSRPYDKDADGIGLGEGLGAVVLKRLRDAQRDGDKIYAVIRGAGSSSDGRNRSMTAPFPDGQVLALRRAYDDAGIDPAAVTLVEAHSTGTAVGDRVELEALQKVFPAGHGSVRSCAIGSVKSNIGHTKTSAGLASLIKTALAIRQRVLPPTIGVEQPNEQFATAGCPFYINTDNRPWLVDDEHPRRCAGVSAFGFGGTNFHLVLEEHDQAGGAPHRISFQPHDAELFAWRSAEREKLLQKLKTLAAELATTPGVDLAQLACSVNRELSIGKVKGDVRCAIVASSVDDLQERIKRLLDASRKGTDLLAVPRAWLRECSSGEFADTCFLFPGQGSQSLNMLKDLILSNDWSYARFESADSLLKDRFPEKLTTLVFPLQAFSEKDTKALAAKLNDTRAAQPALGLFDVFAHDLLTRFGIRPAYAAGHSYGEYVALWAAGCISWDDLMRLSAERGELAAQASEQNAGAMAAVSANVGTVESHVRNFDLPVKPANTNAADQTVIAGPMAAIDEAVKRFAAVGIQAKKLAVTAAFHTPALQSASDALRQRLQGVEIAAPRIPVFSNTTADAYPADPQAMREILANHIVRPVRFVEEVTRLYESGARTFIEVGPGSVLTRLVGRILADRPHTAIALDGGSGRSWTQFGSLLGEMFASGKPVDIERWFEGRALRSVDVASYLRELRDRAVLRPTDWHVNPAGSRPAISAAATIRSPKSRQPSAAKDEVAKNGVTASLAATESQHSPLPNGNGKQPAAPGVRPNLPSIVAASNSSSVTSQLPKEYKMSDTALSGQSAGTSLVTEQLGGRSHNREWAASQDSLGQFQSVMSDWLNLQQHHAKLSERFLDVQESVMRASFGMEPSVPMRDGKRDARPATNGAAEFKLAPAALSVAPAPVIPSLPPIAGQSPADQLRAAVGRRAEAAPASTAAFVTEPVEENGRVWANGMDQTAKHDSNGHANGAPPSVEEFRRNLLDAVSQRTGYPLDMLDENAALEADLGIDSIKTVEIFSSLSTYHAFLPGSTDDQDEALNNFSQLKTLRDIINVYERRRSEMVGASFDTTGSNGRAVSSSNGAATPVVVAEPNGHANVSPVERFTLDSTEVTDAKKKLSLENTYS